MSMNTRKKSLSSKLAALVMLLTLQACSSSSALQQPVTPRLQPTLLPQEISHYQRLAAHLAEGAGVVGELVGLVERRDAQVDLLKQQVLTERALVERLQQ